MTREEQYSNWQNNVQQYLSELKNRIDNNEEARALYKGFYVWDSKLTFDPEIMFIGINPGAGDPNNDYSVNVKPQHQMSYLEYLDGDNKTYNLARHTVSVFSHLGWDDESIRYYLDEKTVKTNFHYIITENITFMKTCLSQISAWDEFLKKSFDFTGELIQIINPKYIICEGNYVYDHVSAFYEPYEYAETKGNNCSMLSIKNVPLIYFGYSRSRYVNTKEEFAELIRPFIKK